MSECLAGAVVSGIGTDEATVLLCDLDEGHAGLHYDATDHILWQKETRDDQP